MRGALLGTVAAVITVASANAQASEPAEIPQPTADGRGAVLFPGGDLFKPLRADPKETALFASYLRESSPSRGTGTGVAAFGATVGTVRWDGPAPGDGVQIGLSGGVFAQFDLTQKSHDLINADYVIGLPITIRRGKWSARARLYHQSSHLGDEFVENNDTPRANLSFQSVELLVSREFGPLRGYGGGEVRFSRNPDGLGRGVLHGGLEYRHPKPVLRIGSLGAVRPVAAVDTKSFQERGWGLGVSGRAGFELGHVGGGYRTVSLLLELYDGPAPYGQFYMENTSYVGFGAHFTM